MFTEYFFQIAKGIPVTLVLTFVSLVFSFILAVGLTYLLALKNKVVSGAIHIFITFFTGTPLLVQIFLIYYSPGQFEWIRDSVLWVLFSSPWFCALLTLSLNSAAYSTNIFYGALQNIKPAQWQACTSLGLSRKQSIVLLLPLALKRSINAYSNEILIMLKSTSLASTITLLDIMGYARQLYGIEYNALPIYGIAGLIYLAIAIVINFLVKKLTKKLLVFTNV